MISLPEEFLQSTKSLFGEELFARYLDAFNEPAPVSIRINPYKMDDIAELTALSPCSAVPWCRYGWYLSERPEFTFDPLFHAGCYYVQEAASMFLAQVMQQYVEDDVLMLDLCAAPGGKSTCACSFLSEDSFLVCNEPIHNRANILFENVTKFGAPNTVVTNNYPHDFRKAGTFDVILADVPCSGEGMFRKDEATIAEWSLQNVEKCWRLQREIISSVWGNLKEGGLLIYSTCTFNTKENEENVRWICGELGADMLSVKVPMEWGITGSLLKDFEEPVYRFIPGVTKGEGLFMAVMRKHGGEGKKSGIQKPAERLNLKGLKVITAESLGKSSSIAEALSATVNNGSYPTVDVSLDMALAYLSREAIVLPKDTPRGQMLITYKGYALGFVKNIGNRANNLYPQFWAIRSRRK